MPHPMCFFHCAWGGRLCLHPFNLGFRIALSRDREIPNLKSSVLSLYDRRLLIQIRDWIRGRSIPIQIAN